MKKCVLSAAVFSLMVPAIYAMDGAEPVVEIEVPAVEVEVTSEVEVEVAPEVEVTVEIAVEELPPGEIEVLIDPVVDEKLEITSELEPQVMICIGPQIDEHGNPVECFLPVNSEVDPQIFQTGVVEGEAGAEGHVPVLYFMRGGVEELPLGAPEGVEEEAVDPNLVDLASQSGVAIEDGTVEVTAIEDNVRNDGEIQPHFRSLTSAPTGEEALMSANNAAADPTADAEPQLLNDEQRGSIRGLRSEAESTEAKPKAGFTSKLMAKFRKPKSEIATVAHTSVDKTLAGQLAQVDRMRDTALKTGDAKLLAKADALEKQIRAKAKTSAK